MNIAERISSSPDGRSGQTKENVRTLEPKSLKSDTECKAICVSVIISPIKCNIIKDRRIETKEPSCSSEAKRNKDFESSSVKIIQNDSKINIYPNCEDKARRDYSSTEHSASFSSSIINFSDKQIITLDSSEDENASGDYTCTGPSLSFISMFPDEQLITPDSSIEENASNDCATTSSSSSLSSISSFLDEQEETLDSFVDEIASRDCTAIEPSTSVYTSGNRDCLSAEESSMDKSSLMSVCTAVEGFLRLIIFSSILKSMKNLSYVKVVIEPF
ncbi:hypothetical protein AVEN_169287-1 [Araneus ventricosus]|uniref:Uncharacterized protein n=1 Tax=Araneus ventricosus TaxID=182803 RepID=A0A4Y2G9G4_ARAVE|nr:hypothetical protein AVEN_169287-1 [Araneus ventricosus]